MRIEWNRYRVRLDAVGRSRWTRGRKVEPTWAAHTRVEDHDLWFIWAGEGRIRLRRGWTDLRPGVCLWLRPGWDYQATQDPKNPLGLNFLHFDLVDARGQRRPWSAPLPPEFIESHDPQLAESATRRIVERCFGFSDRSMSMPPYKPDLERIGTTLLTALLMELDDSTDSHNAGARPKVAPHHDRMIRQIALRMTEAPQETLTIARLAREHGYSPDHFSKIFKTITGQTPELYAVHARIQRAKRLLWETTLSVGEIAAAVGYRDIYFFSRQFKQFTKQSPMQYRKRTAAS